MTRWVVVMAWGPAQPPRSGVAQPVPSSDTLTCSRRAVLGDLGGVNRPLTVEVSASDVVQP